VNLRARGITQRLIIVKPLNFFFKKREKKKRWHVKGSKGGRSVLKTRRPSVTAAAAERLADRGYLSVNSPELIFDLVNAKPGTNHSTNPTNPNGNSKQ